MPRPKILTDEIASQITNWANDHYAKHGKIPYGAASEMARKLEINYHTFRGYIPPLPSNGDPSPREGLSGSSNAQSVDCPIPGHGAATA